MKHNRMLMKKTVALLLLSALPFFFCGCKKGENTGGMELSRRLLIEAVGLDSTGDSVTLSLLTLDTSPFHSDDNTNKSAGGGRFLSFTASTVCEAATQAEKTTGLVPFFSHARVLILGEAAARQDVSSLLDFFLRNRTVRTAIPVCVARGAAAALLEANESDAGETAKLLEQVLATSFACGKSAAMPFFQFISRMRAADTEAYCPLIEKTETETQGSRLQTNGTAVFKNTALDFFLTEAETTALLLLEGKLQETLMKLPTTSGTLACRVRQTSAVLRKKDGASNMIEFRTTLKAERTEAKEDGLPDDPAAGQTEKSLKDAVAAQVTACFHTLYAGHGADLVRIAKKATPQGAAEVKKLQLRSEITVLFD